MVLDMDATTPTAKASPAEVATTRTRAVDDRLFGVDGVLLHDDTIRANWAVPWSDLMMIMFVLFAALLAARALHDRPVPVKQQRVHDVQLQPRLADHGTIVAPKPVPPPHADYKAASPPPSENREQPAQINVLARSQEAVRLSDLKNVEIALLDDKSVKLSVQGPMFFDEGKADLRPAVKNFLDRLAAIIKQTPFDIHIVGHTDDRVINTGIYPSNWELSLARASHVARYLIDAGGLDPARFTVIGRSEYDPVTANTDEQSRARNRRVEIVITREISKTQGANR